ncbi:MAG: hypothetical protein C4K60_01095 [Ideonella sp. MAG2]|nr:MAG: hypothetical protein C4K60_01095 [Ideonella sp. MAG2]
MPPSTADLTLIQATLDALAVPAWVESREGILGANPTLLRLLGLSAQDVSAKSSSSLLADDCIAPWQDMLNRCLDAAEDLPACTSRLKTAMGSERHVELSLRSLRCQASSHWALVTCQDLSDFYHVQIGLQNISGVLSQIISSAPIATFVLDESHRITQWNQACEVLTGKPRTSMLGTQNAWQPFYDSARPVLADLLIDGASEQEISALYDVTVRRSESVNGAFECERYYPNVNGRGRWIYFTAAPLLDQEGRVVGAVETLQDVTQRHEAEEELRRHRDQLETLVQERSKELALTASELEFFLETVPVGVMRTQNGVMRRCNGGVGTIFGLDPEQMLGQPTRGLFNSDSDYAELGALAGPRLSRGEPVSHEMWMLRANGERCWIQIHGHVCDPQDTAAGTWWVLQDRTEVQRAQADLAARLQELTHSNQKLAEAQNQLLQADKMASIGQLAAGVAHEINNPVAFVSSNLNSLKEYVEELLDLSEAAVAAQQQPTNADAQTQLQQLCQTVDLDYLKDDLPTLLAESADGLQRVKRIVQDLKDFSRVDQADWQEADLNQGIESTLNVVRHEVKYKAEVVKRLGALPLVRCLAAQLNQVFLNLIVNASHAIQDKGVITLSSGVQDQWVWIQVEDTGCGMSTEVQRRMFEPFFTTKEVGKGTGLGMSLSFSIVQKHGGSFEVKSELGQGTAIRLWLPVKGPEADNPPRPAVAWSRGEGA